MDEESCPRNKLQDEPTRDRVIRSTTTKQDAQDALRATDPIHRQIEEFSQSLACTMTQKGAHRDSRKNQ